MKGKLPKKIIGYVLFGAAVFVVILYLRFPGDAVRQYLVDRFSATYPDLELYIGKTGPAFPPGLKLVDVVITPREQGGMGIKAEVLKIRPAWLGFLRGQTSVLFHADLYGGEISGKASFQQAAARRGSYSLHCQADGIQLERWGDLKTEIQRAITGRLKAVLVYTGDAGGLASGDGNIELTILNGTYPLRESIFGFDKLDFSRVEVQMALKAGVLKINRLRLNGQKVQCTLKGDVYLAPQDLKQSRLNITCGLELPGLGGKRINLGITGTLGNPTVAFL
jgi:type II secretion system protein N